MESPRQGRSPMEFENEGAGELILRQAQDDGDGGSGWRR
jgi:hypothetical protein